MLMKVNIEQIEDDLYQLNEISQRMSERYGRKHSKEIKELRDLVEHLDFSVKKALGTNDVNGSEWETNPMLEII